MNNAYKLTDEHRFSVCIHEAAHAVIFSLGSAFIERLVVAPVGATTLTATTGRGSEITDLWGACFQVGLFPAIRFIDWDADKECYTPNPDFKELLKSQNREGKLVYKHHVRAWVCGTLAGPIADDIHLDEPKGAAWLEPTGNERHDIDKAYGLAKLLVWRGAFDSLAELTEQTLRRPDMWAIVVRLARELYRVGDMEELDDFLPAAVEGWPHSPT